MKNEKIEIFGTSYKLSELKNHVADISTLATARPYRLLDGPENGVMAIDVKTGSGLEYTVLPDRGMNICNFKYCGIPLDWFSGTGLTSPFLYESRDWFWLRSFNGGLMHTCGLNNVGDPCSDNNVYGVNEEHGIHGRISNIPAKEVSWKTNTDIPPYTIEVTGKCRDISVQGENLLLERKITSQLGAKKITVKDNVKNLGFNRTPVFLLYHCNFGFPLVCKDTKLTIPAKKAVSIKGDNVPNFEKIIAPVNSGNEQVLYPEIDSNLVKISLYNPRLLAHGLGIYIRYKKSELPYLTIWKFFQKRSYALGIEPGICRVGGRVAEKKADRAVFLEPDESINITLEFGVFTKK